MADDRTVRVRYEAVVADFIRNIERMSSSQDQLAAAARRAAAEQEQAQRQAAAAAARAAAEQEAAARRAAAAQSDAREKLAGDAAVAGGALLVGVGLAVAKFTEFDAAMSAAGAATGASGASLEALRNTAIRAGADTQYSATEAAQAITEMGKAGVSTADIYGGGLAGALALAAAGQIEVGRAGEIAATAMNQFGLAGKDIPHIADLLAAGAGKAQGSVDDLAQALNYVGPVAKSMGLSIDETTGILAELAAKGIIGSQAGTGLRATLLSLTAPSKLASQAMQQYGIDVYDASGKLKTGAQIAEVLHQRLGGLDEATRNAALGQIFGNESLTTAITLYEGGGAAVTDWTNKVNDAGYAQKQAAALTDNLKGDVERLGGSLDTVFIQTGSAANASLRTLAQGAEGFVNYLGQANPVVLLVGTSLLGLALVVPKAIISFKELQTTMAAAGLTMSALSARSPALATGLTRAGKAAAGAVVALVALGAASRLTGHDLDAIGTQQLTNDLLDSSDAVGVLNKSFDATKNFGDGAVSNVKSLGDALRFTFNSGIGDQIDGTLGSIFATFGGRNTSDIKAAADRLTDVDKALAGLVTGGKAEKAAQVMASITEAAKAQNISVDDLKRKFPQYAEALAVANSATKEAVTSGKAAADQAQEIAQNYDAATKAFLNYGNAISGSLDAQVAFRQAIDDGNKSLLDQKGNLDKSKKGFDLNTQAGRDNTKTLLAVADAAKKQGVAVLEQTQSTDALSRSVKTSRSEFVDLAVKLGRGRVSAELLATQLGLTEGNVKNLTVAAGKIKPDYKAKVTVETAVANSMVLTTKGRLQELNNFFARPVVAADTAAANAAIEGSQRKLAALNGSSARVTITANIAPFASALAQAQARSIFTLPGKAEGGLLHGPGTGTSDSIPILASTGEYVVKAAAVQRVGVGFLNDVNAMRFADGGYVARTAAAVTPSVSSPGRTAPLFGTTYITAVDPRAAARELGITMRQNLAQAGLTLGAVVR